MDRRLAAILAADVVGYSRLMEEDEAGTLERLQDNRRALVLPQIEKHGGRVVKLMGDGSLVEFPSVVAAVNCALAIQEAMAETDQHIRYRIGINLGDVMVDGEDLYGEGVNVAARLEALAPPGGIALSQTVRDHVAGKIRAAFVDLGEHVVKNQERPIRVFAVRPEASKREPQRAPSDAPAAARARPRVSICVIPFANMSGDPEQEYFSDGITEDIITDLSKVSALFVVSRNTAFTLKGKPVDVAQVARQLNISHILEGSVRKAGGRVRITAQLIDGSSDGHVWAERYDRDLNDIFSLQDEISQAIVAALKIKLLPAEKQAIENRSTNDPEAYQSYLMGRHYHTLHGSSRNLEIAIRFCRRAVEIDPNYARAWALIAVCQADLHYRGRSEESGLVAAEKALAIDPTLADAYAAKGRVLAEIGRFDDAVAAHEKSLQLDPNSFDVRYYYGRTCANLGRHEEAVVHYDRAAELLETDFLAISLACQSYVSLGRMEEAKVRMREAFTRVEKAIQAQPDNSLAVFHGAVILAYRGERDRAKEWASRAMILEPEDTVGQYNIACALAQLGEAEQALDLLEGCHQKMPPECVLWTKNDSDLASLRDQPRFQELIRRGEERLAAAKAKAPELISSGN
jgi:adenylate cyclase